MTKQQIAKKRQRELFDYLYISRWDRIKMHMRYLWHEYGDVVKCAAVLLCFIAYCLWLMYGGLY